MFPPFLTVLNRDFHAGVLFSLLRIVSIRANIPMHVYGVGECARSLGSMHPSTQGFWLSVEGNLSLLGFFRESL